MIEHQVYKPVFVLDIDGLTLTPKDLHEVSIYFSLDRTLPELTFKILDSNGTQISSLYLYIGAKIGVKLCELRGEKDEPTQYMDFIVTRFFDGFEQKDEFMTGYIQVWCKPAWYMFGTYQGHAYPPMKLSELIKAVCSNAIEDVGLVIKDENFETSSDPGNLPRYKTGESDLDFIEQKLLPYTNIDDSNAFFFVNLSGEPRLTSFLKLINQKPTMLITPPNGLNDTIGAKISDALQNYNLTFTHQWVDISLNVGNDDIRKALATVKMRVTFENNETGRVYIANQQPKARLGKDNGDVYNSKVPLNAIKMEYLDATGSKVYPNRNLSDALAMARNEDNNVVDLISISVTIPNIVNLSDIGDVAQLLMPQRKLANEETNATDEEKKKIIYWMNGKWLIKSIQYNQFDSDPNQVATIIELVRPSLQFDKKTTTIAMPSYFYSIDG